MTYRRCRCSQDCKIKIKNPHRIKCGYCGNEVNQINAKHDTGKWFHTECVSDHANFYKSIVRLEPTTKELLFLKNYILTQMIMRNDLRQLHRDWSVLSKMNAIPLVLKPQLNPEVIVFA